MTRTLYLHVGSPKSGTTYVQGILDANRRRLKEAGVLVVGRSQVDRVQAALQVREDPRWSRLPEHRRDMWGRLVGEIRSWDGPSAILSYELFSAASAAQAERALADLAGIEVHVVITARDLARSVPSAWQERLKFGLTTSLESWEPPPPTARRSEWGWRTTDPAEVAGRWGRTLPAEHVHVVTVPRAPAAPADLWRRFAGACGIAEIGLELDLPRANESLGAVGAELLRRVNHHLRPPLDSSRERARWWRDTLAHGVLAQRDDQPLALTDAQFDEAAARAEKAIAALTAAGHVVHGDLEDLRATRPEGRLPGEVTESEVLDAALQTIVDLVLLLREREGGSAAADAGQGPTSLVKRVAQRVASPYVRRADESLQQRIAALEVRIEEDRALHQRVATLQDVVTELLLPGDLRNGAVTARALKRYRRDSL